MMLVTEKAKVASDKVVLRHSFRAKPEVVFKAWTTPWLMERWMDGTAEDYSQVYTTRAKADLKVGGQYEIHMQDRLLHSGEYLEIDPPHRLVFTWNSHIVKNSRVTVEIKARGEYSDLTLTHELLAPEVAPAHAEGWGRVLRHLEATLNQGV